MLIKFPTAVTVDWVSIFGCGSCVPFFIGPENRNPGTAWNLLLGCKAGLCNLFAENG